MHKKTSEVFSNVVPDTTTPKNMNILHVVSLGVNTSSSAKGIQIRLLEDGCLEASAPSFLGQDLSLAPPSSSKSASHNEDDVCWKLTNYALVCSDISSPLRTLITRRVLPTPIDRDRPSLDCFL
ncbi:hypothetical protein KFK09_006020 [Dendrobium nobile]|uniref:Uncharacterized protein n=1 Tax=Dendrobium nobile TaxID=94219 RepID=A0A8T3BXD6_DENNO|nr:hypothetical protein KFK09_006020 [Dendrobium nobile]